MRLPRNFTIRFDLLLMGALGLVVLLMTLVTIAIALQSGSRAARDAAGSLFERSSALIQEKLDSLYGEVLDAAEMGAAIPGVGMSVVGDGSALAARPLLAAMLRTHPSLHSVYLAFPNGDFFQIINAGPDPQLRSARKAPASTAFIIRTINGQAGARRQTWTYLDRQFRTLGRRLDAKPDYDPRKLDWYAGALASDGTYLGTPYTFSTMQVPGITAARRLGATRAVFGADLALGALQQFIAGQRVSERGLILVYDTDGRLLAASRSAASLLGEETRLMQLPGPRAKAVLAGTRVARDRLPRDLANLMLTASTWNLDRSGSMVILMGAPIEDFSAPYQAMRNNFLLMSLIALAIILPLTLVMSRRLTSILVTMAADAEKISNFDFSPTIHSSSRIREFNQLSHSVSGMKETIETTMGKLEKIVELGIDMSSLHDIKELSEKILQGAKDLTHAEGGSLYLRGSGETADKLVFQIILNDKLGFKQGGTSGSPVSLPPVNLFLPDGRPNDHNVVTDAFNRDQTINIPDAYNHEHHDFSGTKKFDESTGYHSQSFLTVPLKPLGREVLGALQLINARDPKTGAVIPFSKGIEDLIKALAAQAATALSNQALLDEQTRLIEELKRLNLELELLFESMINVIVDAIDAKSPYTGGHNKRVPVIAEMLTREANKVSEGPLAGWMGRYSNFDRQFHIAAMLHDCGKITTPEYVVDKATKLETIYNRIHEIRTRFEVLLRDAVIEHHERILAGGKKAAPAADAWLAAQERQLQDDFAFLAECNLGGEFMAPEKTERLKTIAARTWVRHFDDTIGLSWEEAHRIPPEERVPAPATEQLIADKVRHRIAREPGSLARYDQKKFNVKIPELKYNLGEFYNLSISRGTLTDEERFKINEHIMQTIVMLDNLCKNNDTLGDVVTWAGGHHETLKGTGYPYRSSAAELGMPARILSIADIFEALTAKDRPYKKAKTLSDAVKILFNFKKEGHIDPDLFDLFLTSGVYRQYGEKYLAPEQIDEVDISAYVGKMA